MAARVTGIPSNVLYTQDLHQKILQARQLKVPFLYHAQFDSHLSGAADQGIRIKHILIRVFDLFQVEPKRDLGDPVSFSSPRKRHSEDGEAVADEALEEGPEVELRPLKLKNASGDDLTPWGAGKGNKIKDHYFRQRDIIEIPTDQIGDPWLSDLFNHAVKELGLEEEAEMLASKDYTVFQNLIIATSLDEHGTLTPEASRKQGAAQLICAQYFADLASSKELTEKQVQLFERISDIFTACARNHAITASLQSKLRMHELLVGTGRHTPKTRPNTPFFTTREGFKEAFLKLGSKASTTLADTQA